MSSVMNGLQGLDDPQVAAAAEHASRVLQAFISCARGGPKPAASLLEEAKRARGALIAVVDALKVPNDRQSQSAPLPSIDLNAHDTRFGRKVADPSRTRAIGRYRQRCG